VQAVILTGGLGTRLRPITQRVPKAMVEVRGRPFLEYELDLLRREGVDDAVLCVGHLGELIQDHFGDGSAFGLNLRYSWDGPGLLGPAGALKRAEPLLGDRFFVTYGDAYLRAPYRAMMDSFEASGKLAMMAAYRNENRHGRSDIEVRARCVVRYDKKGTRNLSWINYGVTALQKGALSLIPKGVEYGEQEFYGELIARRELLSFPVTKRFYEIGNPVALAEFSRFAARLSLPPP
jgi:N-acetyl-alpha-D-muramate 1-phosphate uridylyltransferase